MGIASMEGLGSGWSQFGHGKPHAIPQTPVRSNSKPTDVILEKGSSPFPNLITNHNVDKMLGGDELLCISVRMPRYIFNHPMFQRSQIFGLDGNTTAS